MSHSKMLKYSTLFTAVVSLMGLSTFTTSQPSFAQTIIVIEDFEDGLEAFETIGETNIIDIEGNSLALLESNSLLLSPFLDSFFGLPTGTLLDEFGAFDGSGISGISETISLNAGDILSFEFNFLTNEATPDFLTNDAAFVVISELPNPLTLLANTESTFIDSDNPSFLEETGFSTFAIEVPTTGEFTLGFGVVNAGDFTTNSGLLIDNITITPTDIPEPSTFITSTIVLGLGLLISKKKVRK